MDIEKAIARIFSAIFHPLIMPCLSVLVLLSLNTYIAYALPGQARRLVLLIIFINTALAPMLVILFLKKAGVIQDVTLNERSERAYPMLVSSLFYLFTYYLFRQANLPGLFSFFVIASTLLVLKAFVITFYWKISIHMISMGGFTGFLIIVALVLRHDLDLLIVLTVVVSGLVGSSRIKLNAHTPSQVYAGYLMGVGVMVLLYAFLRY